MLTYKLVYFKLWSIALDLVQTRKFNNYLDWQSVLLKIVGLKAQFREGLSDKLLKIFSNFSPIEAPSYNPSLDLINFH